MDIYELFGKTVKDAVHRYAKSQSPEQREDFEQDLFVHLLEKRSYIEKMIQNEPLKANEYVYGLCHNQIVNMIRDVGKREKTDPLQEAMHFATDNYHGFGVSEQDLDVAVKQLPVLEQKIIRDLFFESKMERDVGASFGRSQKWVRTAKDRAIRQLRVILDSRK